MTGQSSLPFHIKTLTVFQLFWRIPYSRIFRPPSRWPVKLALGSLLPPTPTKKGGGERGKFLSPLFVPFLPLPNNGVFFPSCFFFNDYRAGTVCHSLRHTTPILTRRRLALRRCEVVRQFSSSPSPRGLYYRQPTLGVLSTFITKPFGSPPSHILPPPPRFLIAVSCPPSPPP